MPELAWEDLDVFLDTDDFAVPARLRAPGKTGTDLKGVFDDPYMNVEIGEYDLDTTRPRFLCRAADAASATRGDELVIGGVVFDVMTGPQDTGDGMAVLELTRRQE